MQNAAPATPRPADSSATSAGQQLPASRLENNGADGAERAGFPINSTGERFRLRMNEWRGGGKHARPFVTTRVFEGLQIKTRGGHDDVVGEIWRR